MIGTCSEDYQGGKTMKIIVAVMVAVLVSGTCLAAQRTAPAATPKGVQNSKKVTQQYKQRYQRVKEVKKRVHVQKEQARRKQLAAAPLEGGMQ
jgi:mannitol-specific phosphotransferase system IIBC component